MQLISDIVEIYRNYPETLQTEVLVASVRDRQPRDRGGPARRARRDAAAQGAARPGAAPAHRQGTGRRSSRTGKRPASRSSDRSAHDAACAPTVAAPSCGRCRPGGGGAWPAEPLAALLGQIAPAKAPAGLGRGAELGRAQRRRSRSWSSPWCPRAQVKLVADPGVTVTPVPRDGVAWAAATPVSAVEPGRDYFAEPPTIRVPFAGEDGKPVEADGRVRLLPRRLPVPVRRGQGQRADPARRRADPTRAAAFAGQPTAPTW